MCTYRIKVARVVTFWRTPIRIMIFFGLYYLVKKAIYLSSKKIFNVSDHKRKKSKRKSKRAMKGIEFHYIIHILLINILWK